MPLVEPGDAEGSYLYLKCLPDFESRGIGSGLVMPADAPLLEAADLELLRAWIDGGAAP